MGPGAHQKSERSCFRRYLWLIVLITLVVIAAAIAVPLAVIKPWDKNKSNSGSGSGSGSGGQGSASPDLIQPDAIITPSSDNSAQVNSYTPALNQAFDYANGTVKMRGVNLGGWLVLEPFITPSLFDPYISAGVVDEWTLCAHLGPEKARSWLENHYASWVTEDTFKQIKDVGLNHVRIPIGFWAMGNLTAEEPYVANISWKYLLRGIEWARKYGIRVMVELHAAPGSQNGWNHSGRSGQINWINGTQGAANALRTLPYLQQMATFFSSPDYVHVNPVMGMLNEPAAYVIGAERVMAWYKQAFATVRKATGTGKGPWAIIHDGFLGLQTWSGFMAGSDRLMIDAHQYIMFDQNLMMLNQSAQLKFACENWGSDSTKSTKDFGPTMVGEFSVAVNDCATYLNGVGVGYRWDGTFPGSQRHSLNSTCTNENTVSMYSSQYKEFLANYFSAQLDAFEQGAGWFYWNFKTESNPLWSYFDGVENGWIPKDVNNRGPSYCSKMGYLTNQTIYT